VGVFRSRVCLDGQLTGELDNWGYWFEHGECPPCEAPHAIGSVVYEHLRNHVIESLG